MADSDLAYRSATFPPPAMVPADYAEKAMGSLMQLHSELMEEKERRVDLYRRLMDREQAVAELRMYVKILEDRLGLKDSASPPNPPVPSARTENGSAPAHQPAASSELPRRPISAGAFSNYRVPPRKEVMSGWKVW